MPGAESLQFRDVEGVSNTVAYLLSIGTGSDSRIYKTTDGGMTWSLQFQNQDPAAFFDCFAFWTPTRGFAQSDSVNGQFPVVRTTNGQTWESISGNEPAALPGEFFFASSGTCVATEGKNNAWAVTGGASPSRAPSRATAVTHGTPTTHRYAVRRARACSALPSGTGSTGWWAARSDPTAPPFDQTATSSDGGKTWVVTPQQPNIGTVFGPSYAADAGKARSTVGRRRHRPGRRGVDTRRGRLVDHVAWCDRLLGSRIREPADRLAGRDRRPNPAGRLLTHDTEAVSRTRAVQVDRAEPGCGAHVRAIVPNSQT